MWSGTDRQMRKEDRSQGAARRPVHCRSGLSRLLAEAEDPGLEAVTADALLRDDRYSRAAGCRSVPFTRLFGIAHRDDCDGGFRPSDIDCAPGPRPRTGPGTDPVD